MDGSDEKKDFNACKLLCNGCLCIGRTLHKITDEKLAQFYLNALKEIPSETSSVPSTCPTMCWECKASLKKAATFKEQMQDSHRILQAYTNESLRECLLSDIVRSSRLRPQLNSFVSIDPEPQTELHICRPSCDRLDAQQCDFFKEEPKNESPKPELDDDPMDDDGPSDIDNVRCSNSGMDRKMSSKPKYPDVEFAQVPTEEPLFNDIKTRSASYYSNHNSLGKQKPVFNQVEITCDMDSNEVSSREFDDEPIDADGQSDIDNPQALKSKVCTKKKKKKKKNKLESKVKRRTDKVVKRLQHGAKMTSKPKYPDVEFAQVSTETESTSFDSIDIKHDNSSDEQSPDDSDDEYDNLPSRLVEITHDMDGTEVLPQGDANNEIHEDIDEDKQGNNLEDARDEIPKFDFVDIEGPTFGFKDNLTPVDVLNEIFNEDILNYLVACTNANGAMLSSEEHSANKTRNSRFAKFNPTDSKEMKQFLGLTLLHGHIKIPMPRKLFTYTDILYHHPIFTHAMTGRRYEQLIKCFNAAVIGTTSLDMIKQFSDDMMKILRSKYQPGVNLLIDECLIHINGRLHLRNSLEPDKSFNGIKLYTLTDSDGYVLNLETYLEADDVVCVSGDPSTKIDELVCNLMNPYLHKGHNIYMTSFYNSVRLSQKLLNLGTHSHGVMRSNSQDVPEKLQKKVLNENQHIWTRKGKVYVTKWQNKKPVYALTTKDFPQMVLVRSRKGNMLKPKEIIPVKSNLRTSRLDQMIEHYSCPRKLMTSDKLIVFHILDICLWNSFVLFKKYAKNGSTYDYIMFREEIVKSYLYLNELKVTQLEKRNKHDNRRVKRDIGIVKTSRFPNSHWPIKTEAQNSDPKKKKASYLSCKMCYKKKMRKETCYRCQGCPNHPPLCPGCFREWHETVAQSEH